MVDLALAVWRLAEDAPSPPDHTIVSGLIAAASAVIVALIGYFTVTHRRGSSTPAPEGTNDTVADYRQRLDDLEDEKEGWEKKYWERAQSIDYFLSIRGFDPKLILTGRETDDEVRSAPRQL